ncbi:MAG: branched-chain amino acid ABC transporter permease [Burkholderiaceae bacterium]|nr:branched-chain amino acid ABC transporter permease [Burkholderiaceae bacterium]
MQYLSSLVITGIAAGALYGLVAMGFAMIYKVSRVVNFAQGEVMMLIAYTAYTVAAATGGSVLMVILTVIGSAVVVGFVLERAIIRPMLGQPVFSIVMMTIALAVLIKAVVGMTWGVDPHRFPMNVGSGGLEIMGARLSAAQVWLIGIYAAMCAAIWAFLRFNVVGIAMRATASDPTVTMLMGVSISRIYRMAWILSALMAGTAGVLLAMVNNVGIEMSDIGIRAFPAAVMGGLDSVVGAGMAGVLIGVIENLAGGYLGTAFKEVAGFAVILVILMVRPYGFFGERDIERV